jgi:hypothetical protein
LLAATGAVSLATRSPAAAAAFMGASSGLTEAGVAPVEFFQEMGIDVSTPEGALAAISDPAIMDAARQRGYLRGLMIGVFDGLSGGVVGQQLASSPIGNAVLQSIAQLSARYGRDYALSIQGGFNTYLTYSGADPETARFFETIAGKVIETRRDKIEDITAQRYEYNLLNSDAVRRITDHQAVLVSANKNPAIIETEPYFAARQSR